jgi:hypothetical protein
VFIVSLLLRPGTFGYTLVFPLPQYAFMAWCLIKHWDNFTYNVPNIFTGACFLSLIYSSVHGHAVLKDSLGGNQKSVTSCELPVSPVLPFQDIKSLTFYDLKGL